MDALLFRIPEECPNECGQVRRSNNNPLISIMRRGKMVEVRMGCPHSLSAEGLARKQRLEKYNDYKDDLRELAEEKALVIPSYNVEINFFMPVFRSWTNKKKRSLHFALHYQKPDTDNLLKALQDALKRKDETLAHFKGLSKRWVNFPTGYIEIIIHHGPEPKYRP